RRPTFSNRTTCLSPGPRPGPTPLSAHPIARVVGRLCAQAAQRSGLDGFRFVNRGPGTFTTKAYPPRIADADRLPELRDILSDRALVAWPGRPFGALRALPERVVCRGIVSGSGRFAAGSRRVREYPGGCDGTHGRGV